jgi:3-oxoacyl-[acyl-carrier protein] reductase
MNLELNNKVYFISGSSKGIGFFIAQCFLEEGAKVVITGRDDKALKKAESILREKKLGQVLALGGDLTDPDTIRALIKKTVDHFGKLDGVIANIGSGSEPMGMLEGPEIWESSYDVNIKSSMLLAQESALHMKKMGGSITFISSIAGIEDIQAPLAYSVHKAALVAASKKLSRILAVDKTRVNVIAPGNIFFPGGVWEKKKNKDEKNVLDYISSMVPLNTFGEPEDIGYLCVFLASKKAKFITGSVIVADGGQTKSY